MKQLLPFLLLACAPGFPFKAFSQENGSFTFVITDMAGRPVPKARLVVLNGENHMASPGGIVVYYGEEDYVKKNGVFVKTRTMPLYINVKAPYYKERQIRLYDYKLGSTIAVKLERLPDDYKTLDVFVKDKSGKPISGAAVMVNPGKTTFTDARGYAEAQHVHVIDEWIQVLVQKEGYKNQRQQIMSGDAKRTVNGQVIPGATLYFTLEKGSNETTIFHINVEVLDYETEEPVPGAAVLLEVSDGTVQNGSTNSNGECRFSDMEYSYRETTSRVKVSKTGYQEAWSDITGDLMTGQDNSERQFLIYMKKKAGEDDDWSGNWEGNSSWGKHSVQASGSGSSFSASTTHAKNNGFTDKGQISGCVAEGGKLKCRWTEQFEDGDKKISRKGTVTLSKSGNSLSGVALEEEPSISWKPGISPYSSSIRKGAVWNWTVSKKN